MTQDFFNFRYNFVQDGFVPTKTIHTQDDGKFHFWNNDFTQTSGPYESYEQCVSVHSLYESQG